MSDARHKYLVRIGGMPWFQKGATHNHEQLGFPDKDMARMSIEL